MLGRYVVRGGGLLGVMQRNSSCVVGGARRAPLEPYRVDVDRSRRRSSIDIALSARKKGTIQFGSDYDARMTPRELLTEAGFSKCLMVRRNRCAYDCRTPRRLLFLRFLQRFADRGSVVEEVNTGIDGVTDSLVGL